MDAERHSKSEELLRVGSELSQNAYGSQTGGNVSYFESLPP